MKLQLFFLLLLSLLLSSCSSNYEIGSTGEAGGIVFYDSGEYDTKGWRYLEVAPDNWYGEEDDPFKGWGWNPNTEIGGTKTTVGTGLENTMVIIATFRDIKTAADFASEYSNRYRGNNYNDWFLPSREELILIHKNLVQKRIGDFRYYDSYWSSSEYNHVAAWAVDFSDGTSGYFHKGGISAIRPIRSF